MKKRIVAFAVFALVICAVSVVFASAEKENTVPKIISQNVKYTDKFSLMYAVDADTVEGGEATLRVYKEYPAESSVPIYEQTDKTAEAVTPSGGSETQCYVFTAPGVGAGMFTQNFYVTVTDKAGNTSAVYRYSQKPLRSQNRQSYGEQMGNRISDTSDRYLEVSC